MPAGRIPCTSGEQTQLVVQSLVQLSGTEKPDAGCSQLDRQWEPIEPAANVRHIGNIRFVQLEVWTNLFGPLDKERDRFDPGNVLHRRNHAGLGHGERVDVNFLLAPQS